MTNVESKSEVQHSTVQRRWPKPGSWPHKLFNLFYHSKVPQRLDWTTKLVDRFWDGISKTRLVELNFSRLGGKALIAAFSHLLPKEGRILDFGAGDGDLIEMMCKRGLQVAAYEPSMGRSRNLQKRLSGEPGFLGTVDTKSAEVFDVVLLIEVIEHILQDQLEDSLNLVARYTRTGGILIVTTPNNEDLELNMAYCPVSNTLYHRWQHVRSFTPESLGGLLAAYGFEQLAIHQLEYRDDLYLPYDAVWGSPTVVLPPHIEALRANRSTYTGSGMGLAYIGRRLSK
jgi:2-polyprenyl-3-methyl-5-hydroxy-6-metoxy-1,4-benzoquinol methylase